MSEEKVISMTDIEPSKMQMLHQWLKELIFPGKVADFFQEIAGQWVEEKVTRSLCFYTEEYQYIIKAIEYNNGDKDDYLSCQVTARKTRAGEDWLRGNDLPDGPFTKKTWDRIIYSIVSYEMVKLSKFQKPDTVPENIA